MNTIESLSALSDEELNVRLAELAGWKRSLDFDKPGSDYFRKLRAPSVWEWMAAPRFCSDLNETAKVEAGLTRDQCHAYQDTLLELVRSDAPLCHECESGKAAWATRWTWHATARQRTIALIAALS